MNILMPIDPAISTTPELLTLQSERPDITKSDGSVFSNLLGEVLMNFLQGNPLVIKSESGEFMGLHGGSDLMLEAGLIDFPSIDRSEKITQLSDEKGGMGQDMNSRNIDASVILPTLGTSNVQLENQKVAMEGEMHLKRADIIACGPLNELFVSGESQQRGQIKLQSKDLHLILTRIGSLSELTSIPLKTEGKADIDLLPEMLNMLGKNAVNTPVCNNKSFSYISPNPAIIDEPSVLNESAEAEQNKGQDKDAPLTEISVKPENIYLHTSSRNNSDNFSALQRVTEPSEIIHIRENTFVITKKSDSSIEVSLKPDGMGKINIELCIDRGVINAQINASETGGKEFIERNINNIINTLISEGLNIGDFSVSLKDKKYERRDNAIETDIKETQKVEGIRAPIAYNGNSAISIFV